jgi:hypothetical protein
MRVALGKAARIVVLATALAACHAAPPVVEPVPASRSEWSATLSQSRDEVVAGRYGVADRLLAEFGTRYPASPEAEEATFWRALYKLDPGNPTAAPREAAALLDGYLSSGQSAHRTEAQILRRIAAAVDTRAVVSSGTAVPPAEKPRAAEERAKDEELVRLKEELGKANAELDRIKRRLAQPKP